MINFPKLVLDPQNEDELTQLTYARIQAASGNTINDFRPGSAVAALVEGQTFALAELLYYFNMLPEAIAIEVFRLYGIERSLGTQATGQVTFLLETVAADDFVIPIGYQIAHLDTQLTLLQALYIPQGLQEGTVSVQVADVGTKYNAKPFDITITSSGLGRVQSIFNRSDFTGGSDLESLDNLITRCQNATVTRSSVITKLDYEQQAQRTLGVGSRAVALPNLSSDGITFRQASVGVFLLDATGKPASATTCALVKAELASRILIGTDVNCFPAVLVDTNVEVFCNVESLSEALGTSIAQAVVEYMNPVTYNGGMILRHNELEFIARKVPGVTSVDSILMDGQATDRLLPQPYSFFNPVSVTVTMMDNIGTTYSVYAGE